MEDWEWEEKRQRERGLERAFKTFFVLIAITVVCYFAFFFDYIRFREEAQKIGSDAAVEVEEALQPTLEESMPATITGVPDEPVSSTLPATTLKEKAGEAIKEGAKEGAKKAWYEFWSK